MNFLIRIACQVVDGILVTGLLISTLAGLKVNEPNSTAGSGSPGEVLSRRCVALLKTALRPDVWPGGVSSSQSLLHSALSNPLLPLCSC